MPDRPKWIPPPRLAARLRRLGERLRLEQDWHLILVAMGIGLLMGTAAVAFILPLRLIEEWAAGADRNVLYRLVPAAPVLGALLAGAVVHLIRGTGESPGVSAVLYAIHRRKSQLPLTMAARKWIASTLTIGSGGSAGAEGPIVTIGSVIGSNLAGLLKVGHASRATLLGCGAAAGISAIFNAPIAGIFFVLEILLRDFSLRTFTPIVIASVVASAWAQGILGEDPIFAVQGGFFAGPDRFNVFQIPNFLLLGLACGAASALFVHGLDATEGFFARLKRVHPILRPALGAAGLGVLGLAYLWVFRPEHPVPAFYGNGYPVIQGLLDEAFYQEARGGLLLLLCAIAILKVLATCLTIGSGGAGGLFAPSLLIGASMGGAFGYAVNALGWSSAAHPASYALAGMGAVVAATAHAPLTAILLVYEITRSYETILPLMLVAVISTTMARLIHRDSVYTVTLSRLGVRLGAMSDLTILRRLSVQDVPLAEGVAVRADDSAQRLLELSEEGHVGDFIVTDGQGRYRGLVSGADLKAALLYREAIPLLQVSELMRTDLPTVTPDDTLDVVLDRFASHDVQSLAVLRSAGDARVLGLITRSRLMERYQRALVED